MTPAQQIGSLLMMLVSGVSALVYGAALRDLYPVWKQVLGPRTQALYSALVQFIGIALLDTGFWAVLQWLMLQSHAPPPADCGPQGNSYILISGAFLLLRLGWLATTIRLMRVLR